MVCTHKNNENTSYLFPIRACSFIVGWLWKGYGFLKQKNNITSIPFFFCFKNPYSFLDLILWVRTIALLESYFSGINVVSDGLHSQKQCMIIPSAVAVARSKGIVFLFAYWGFSDCVCEKVDAIDFNQRRYLKVIKVVLWTCMASAFSQMQLLGILWQMKKRYSCWPFDFVGAGYHFIGIFNLPIDVVSDGLHSQKQCIIIPSVMGQERRQGYCFFLRIKELKIVFVEKLVPDLLLRVLKIEELYCSTIWQLLFRKNNGSLINGKKKTILLLAF
jgi:hypothetical protein